MSRTWNPAQILHSYAPFSILPLRLQEKFAPELKNVGFWYFPTQRGECFWQMVHIMHVYVYCTCPLMAENFVVFVYLKAFFFLVFWAVSHEARRRSAALSWKSCKFDAFWGLCCRGESQSRHGSAVGQNQSIRSFACTLMPIVARAQRNSSVVS